MRALIVLMAAVLATAAAQVVIVSSAGLDAETFVEARVPDGAVGVVAGELRGASAAWPALLEAGGWRLFAPAWDEPLDRAPGLALASDRADAARRSLVRPVGAERVAFLALAFAPQTHAAALDDAEAALRAALDDVPAGVPVVLVVNGDRADAAALLRRLPRLALALVAGAGGGDPAPVPVGDAWLVEVPWGGAQWGVTSARVDGERLVQLEHRPLLPHGWSEAVAEAKRAHGLPVAPLEALLRAAPTVAATRDAPGADAAAVEAASAADARGANRAAALEIVDARVQDRYGELRAGAGAELLVLEVAFENIIPLTLVRDLEVSTEYRFNDLADHAYVVVNGSRLARLVPGAEEAPGHLAVRPFRIERPGERVRGNLVFELPVEEVHTLEFRLYDDAHGRVQVPLRSGDPVAQLEPLVPLAVNEIVELGVYGLELSDVLDGRAAPEGMRFAVVELLARSMFTFEADATAFDPHAQAGERTVVGTVADWLEAHHYLHLVADGVHAYAPDAQGTTLPADPRFLPDVMTGGRVVFTVPADTTSLTLRADFPNARLPDRSVIRPEAIELALVGATPAPAERTALWSVRDDTLEVSINAMRVEETFAGVAAGERRFVVLEVAVHNLGQRPEWFQTAEQLRYVDASGRQSAPHEATFEGRYRPTEHVWVPEAQTRVFEVAYLVPASERQPRLAYRGFTLAEIVALPVIGE